MRRLWPRVLMMLTVLAGGVGCQSGPALEPVAGTLRTEVERLNRSMEESLRAGDLLGVAGHYADDAILIGPSGNRVTGRTEIDAYWMRFSDPVDWSLSVGTLEGEADLLCQRGTSRLTYRRGDAVRTSVVEFLLIWRREEDGRLRIAVDAYW
ncbi:MAG: DUF4440 domain-containing protein [Phycisphaerales bacterium]|nr:DUF4440 domain-containing protein [Phycisphaerae bacterium]NNF43605.1 DUF4440 domain-containing protein [Phycisphaerales bacterium]NNM24932.1 DUF4440 domain-containing protein [Phycisphaerales bacterium]